MRFLYPDGKYKALTFSYDDGQEFDRTLVEILNRNNMKGTFHLNSGKLGLHRGKDNYVSAEEVGEIYRGHEVACHGVQHRNLPTITVSQMVKELEEDRKALESITGCMVQGMSYAFGNYSDEVKHIASSLGIKYSRTVRETESFFPPVDFMEWHPTCHHDNPKLMELGEKFIHMPGFYELPVMYVWGHSFEFGWPDDWRVIEEFTGKMAGLEDTWYATNMEICNYILAVRAQEFSADGITMHNPTAQRIWVSTENGVIDIEPGETKKIGEL